jgi:hypothetical protein
LLRLWASIGSGLAPPSVILRKIAAAPRQNALARALKEIGRIERSIFICEWLLDPVLRRRAHGNLNKGETRHSLARAVFVHQLGEPGRAGADAVGPERNGLLIRIRGRIENAETCRPRNSAKNRMDGSGRLSGDAVSPRSRPDRQKPVTI